MHLRWWLLLWVDGVESNMSCEEKKITTGNYYNELQLNTMYGKGKRGRQNMKTGDV